MSESLRILYIEDEAANRNIMQIILNMLGYQDVTLLADTQNIMKRITSFEVPFDIILLDVNLKPYNGFTACVMLRQNPIYEQTKIIGVTASVSPAEWRRMKSVGFNGCIGKPISYDTFSLQFDRILSGDEVWEES